MGGRIRVKGKVLDRDQEMTKTNNHSHLRWNEFYENFLIGGVSAGTVKTFTAPLERVKLLIQLQDARHDVLAGDVKRYNGVSDCIKRVYQEQGWRSFWRGNWTNIVRYFPTQAFNFAFKDSFKHLFPTYHHQTQFNKFLAVNILSGGLAGASSLLIVYPLDYARTRLAADVGSSRDFHGLLDCIKRTVRSEQGFFALYKGFGVSVITILIGRGMYFGLFDSFREKNPWKDQYGFVGLSSKFVCAQGSTLVAAYTCYPFDTVRRRLQLQAEKPKSQHLYRGMVDCFRESIRNEGFLGMYKGAGVNAVRTIGTALVLVVYDLLHDSVNANKHIL